MPSGILESAIFLIIGKRPDKSFLRMLYFCQPFSVGGKNPSIFTALIKKKPWLSVLFLPTLFRIYSFKTSNTKSNNCGLASSSGVNFYHNSAIAMQYGNPIIIKMQVRELS